MCIKRRALTPFRVRHVKRLEREREHMLNNQLHEQILCIRSTARVEKIGVLFVPYPYRRGRADKQLTL